MSPAGLASTIVHALRQAALPTTSARTAAVHLAVAGDCLARLRDEDPGHPQLAALESRLRGLTAQLSIDGVRT